MNRQVLIVRPQPGASATAGKAKALGLEPIIAPLFEVRPLEWKPPVSVPFDSVLLTSANGARYGGDGLRAFANLPCYAVGEATAKAAREAGFQDVRVGPSDATAITAMMVADGVHFYFHPRGRHHLDFPTLGIGGVGITVYEAEACDVLPEVARAALAAGAVALIHSPRSGSLLAKLIKDHRSVRIAAISAAAAEAAGQGWGECRIAAAPRDEPLLELAAKLCQIGGPDPGSGA